MAPIQDRSNEHLATDQVIVTVRKLLLKGIKDVQEAKHPPHVIRDPKLNHFPDLIVIGEVVPRSTSWRDFIKTEHAEGKV